MSRFKNHVPQGSIFLAPMEGVTDDIYRNTVFEQFGGWDFYACDFLRIPSVGLMPKRLIRKHIGEKTLQNKKLLEKTYLQILASSNSLIEEHLDLIKHFNMEWIDLNIGCPSKKVNGHCGGAYLLQDLVELQKILKRIRKNFHGIFTAKIRVGYHDDKNFTAILKLLEDEGVEAITIHARTKDQMYKGKANWDYIKKAVQVSSLPIIGNGDIVKPIDIKNMLTYTGSHGVMVARGALQNPWLAKLYKTHTNHLHEISHDPDYIETYKRPRIKTYFTELEKNIDIEEDKVLKRFKGLSKYVVADLNEEALRPKLLRSKELQHFMSHIQML